MISSFFRGFFAPLRALKTILSSPKIITLVAIPLLINVAFYFAFFFWGSHLLALKFAVLQSWIVAHAVLPAWAVSTLAFGLGLLKWLVLATVAALSFTVISGIIASPFNEILCRATFKHLAQKHAVQIVMGKPNKQAPTSHIAPTIKETIVLEARRLCVLIAGSAGAMLLGLIPLMQIPALAIGALLLSFEYFGFPSSQYSLRLRYVATFVLKNPFVSLGFGSFLLLMMAIPFASIVYLPLAVVGASTLFFELNQTN